MSHRPARRAKDPDARRAFVHLELVGSDIRLDWRDQLEELRHDMERLPALVYVELWAAHVATPEEFSKLMTALLDTWDLTPDEPELETMLRGAVRNPAIMAGV
jgi:hypothetical protein